MVPGWDKSKPAVSQGAEGFRARFASRLVIGPCLDQDLPLPALEDGDSACGDLR